jgi:TetR/AcrR family transcriptional regulator, mexJK operon transcriptional repressor
MEDRLHTRAQQTRERIRAAAQRLFLRQGYLATSIDAILAEAGISSKETLYRYYANKETLFVDILGNLSMEQPGVSDALAALPTPRDLASLRQALSQVAREILAILSQPEYVALVRIIIAESPRFPQLGALFIETVTQRGFTIISTLLRQAGDKQIIADVDIEIVTRALIGGLLSYVIPRLMSVSDETTSPVSDRADALVGLLLRALMPQ